MIIDSRNRKGIRARSTSVIAAICLCSGCNLLNLNVLQTIPIEEKISFRAEAVQFLRESAFSSDPIVTMQTLEALQEVAPHENPTYMVENLYTGHTGVTFAALMALGTLERTEFLEEYRIKAEDANPNVRIAAIYAMHRCGDKSRTGELPTFLMQHKKARVRANAALAIGRLGVPSAVKLLRRAMRNEKKTIVRNNIHEALLIHGDPQIERTIIQRGHSSLPLQAAEALMMLANARCQAADDVFRNRLVRAEHPEIKLEAARGLGRLGEADHYTLDLSARHLFFKSPRHDYKEDPRDQQIRRVRGLAALALEAIESPEALAALRAAFTVKDQSEAVKVAIARAAIRIIDVDLEKRRGEPPGRPPVRPSSISVDELAGDASIAESP
ncbi:MAG: HEAT repeat domain-containing protein [Planctomycetota bacterium]|nr:HEAT repeat domain-containing protein [Planctomycetota bacterium]